MEVNGQNFENITFSKATEILRNNTHLSITVKTNIFGEYLAEMLIKILSAVNFFFKSSLEERDWIFK